MYLNLKLRSESEVKSLDQKMTLTLFVNGQYAWKGSYQKMRNSFILNIISKLQEFLKILNFTVPSVVNCIHLCNLYKMKESAYLAI